MDSIREKGTQGEVLVVDDQASMRVALCDLVRMLYPAAHTLEASSAHAGFALFAARRPGVVLVDVHLPDADGGGLTRRIKALAPETVVVMISTDCGAHLQDYSRAAGAHAFIPKDRLFAQLGEVLQRAGVVPEAPR